MPELPPSTGYTARGRLGSSEMAREWPRRDEGRMETGFAQPLYEYRIHFRHHLRMDPLRASSS
jgi:hypothetical protein